MSYWLEVSLLAEGFKRLTSYPQKEQIDEAIAKHDHFQIFRWKNSVPSPKSLDDVHRLLQLETYLNKLADLEAFGKDSEVDPVILESVATTMKLIYRHRGDKCHIGHNCSDFNDCVLKVVRKLS